MPAAMGGVGVGFHPWRAIDRLVQDRVSSRSDLSAKQTWKLVFKIAVSGGLLAVLFVRIDWSEVGRTLGRADVPVVIAALALYIAGQALSALKWRLLAFAVGFRASVGSFMSYYFIGMFFNAFGLGTVGGDVVRALYLAGPERRRTLALNTVIVDRVSGLLVLLAIALVSLLAFHTYELPAVLYWSTLAFSAALLAGWRLAPYLLPKLLSPGTWLRRLVESDLAPYWNDYGLLARASAISLVFHLSQMSVLALLAIALQLSIPWSYFLVFGPLVNIFSALPISMNGLGVREGGFVYFLSHIGLPRESAIAFALLWFALVLMSGLCGGAVYLWHRNGPDVEEDG